MNQKGAQLPRRGTKLPIGLFHLLKIPLTQG